MITTQNDRVCRSSAVFNYFELFSFQNHNIVIHILLFRRALLVTFYTWAIFENEFEHTLINWTQFATVLVIIILYQVTSYQDPCIQTSFEQPMI